MKKKTIANLIMVWIIGLIITTGAVLAWYWYTPDESEYGALYAVSKIEDDRLVSNAESENLCTITIRCATVFENEAQLDPEKKPYIPQDGIVLPVTTVEFSEGETVFEVLQRVCEAAGLQLEYRWPPLYDRYYVEGINHLYEFDCGFESGWMYKVNEWFPNYGCSSYVLEGGEEIVWYYTCVGLGTDVGAEREDMQ